MPCAIRDHHEVCRQLLETYHPEPEDEMAAAALQDEDYHRGLVEYDRRLAELTESIWEKEYLEMEMPSPLVVWPGKATREPFRRAAPSLSGSSR